MHELSIAQNLVEIVQPYLSPGDGQILKSIKLKIGELAGVLPDSLQFCFEAVSQGTPLQGAELTIVHVPIRCRCAQCSSVFTAGRYVFICPDCASSQVEMVSGRELEVVELELEPAGAGESCKEFRPCR